MPAPDPRKLDERFFSYRNPLLQRILNSIAEGKSADIAPAMKPWAEILVALLINEPAFVPGERLSTPRIFRPSVREIPRDRAVLYQAESFMSDRTSQRVLDTVMAGDSFFFLNRPSIAEYSGGLYNSPLLEGVYGVRVASRRTFAIILDNGATIGQLKPTLYTRSIQKGDSHAGFMAAMTEQVWRSIASDPVLQSSLHFRPESFAIAANDGTEAMMAHRIPSSHPLPEDSCISLGAFSLWSILPLMWQNMNPDDVVDHAMAILRSGVRGHLGLAYGHGIRFSPESFHKQNYTIRINLNDPTVLAPWGLQDLGDFHIDDELRMALGLPSFSEVCSSVVRTSRQGGRDKVSRASPEEIGLAERFVPMQHLLLPLGICTVLNRLIHYAATMRDEVATEERLHEATRAVLEEEIETVRPVLSEHYGLEAKQLVDSALGKVFGKGEEGSFWLRSTSSSKVSDANRPPDLVLDMYSDKPQPTEIYPDLLDPSEQALLEQMRLEAWKP